MTLFHEDCGLSLPERQVIALSRQHSKTWRDEDDPYWLSRLMEEVGELAGALVGNHEGPVTWELQQIATICINWLDKLENEDKEKSNAN